MIHVYGIKEKLDPIKAELSDIICACMAKALGFPPEKRFHRFFPMASEDFYYADGRSDAYTVIEINMMAGRSPEAKKELIHLLFAVIEQKLGIAPIDVEIAISEAPPCNFGFRGVSGDGAKLNYRVNV
jgi:phenylpyruvate tautomerase PptA (4-oxalocrotonate tautomerase family)